MPATVLPFSPAPSPWFTARASAGKGVIDIRGEIGLPKVYEDYGMEASGTVSEFAAALADLGDVSEIELNIYSPGGEVFAALAMHALLVRHPARVVANIDGVAASAATILMLAADEIRMPENAYLMIHNATLMAWGDHRDLLKAADQLRKWTRDMADLYTARIEDNVGGERPAILADIIAKMDDTTWLTGTEAKALGLVETVTGRVQMAASLAGPVSAPLLASLQHSCVPESLRALLFDSAGPSMSIPAPAIAAPEVAPVETAPVEALAEAPAAPVEIAPEAAPVVEAPVAVEVVEAPAPVAPVPQALTLDSIRAAIGEAVAPLAERLATAEASLAHEQGLRAAGVPLNAWGNQAPADIPTGDAPSAPDFATLTAGEKIRMGREKLHPAKAAN